MISTENDIQVINGNPRLLLIAPHGHPKDDENTAELTLGAAGHLGCQAIVNRAYRKPRGSCLPRLDSMQLNLNKSNQARLHPVFLNAIRKTVDAPGKTAAIWIHGIKDSNIALEAERTVEYNGNPDRLTVLVGFGQGHSPKTGEMHHQYTASPQTCKRMIDRLTANGLTALAVRSEASNYRGRHEDYMNQWFVQNGYPHSEVESLQLEFKFTGVRDKNSLADSAEFLAAALCGL